MSFIKRWIDNVTDSNASLPLVLLFFLNLVDEFDQVLFGVVAPEIGETFDLSDSSVISLATISGALVIMAVVLGILSLIAAFAPSIEVLIIKCQQ